MSNSLKGLQGWGIVKVVHVMGDRRDRFESERDVWTLFQIIMDERKKREMDPTLVVLKRMRRRRRRRGMRRAHARIGEFLAEFVDSMTAWYGHLRKLPPTAWRKMAEDGRGAGEVFWRLESVR